MKTNKTPLFTQEAIDEIKAVADERAHGPKHHAKCPDCGATLSVRPLENGRTKLDFVKHAS